MNYQELATRLSQLSNRLDKHSEKIEGEPIGRAAGKLLGYLDTFEERLDSFLASRKSGEFLLETLLRSPAAKKHLSLEILKKAHREIVGKRLKAEDLAGAKKEFVGLVHRDDKASEAATFLKEIFAAAVHVQSGGKDKSLLQKEFIRLGALGDEEFSHEIRARTFGELRRLATATGIKFTDKTTKERLIVLIRRYAQRAAINIATAV
jgi:hypothetical protein